MEALSHRVPRLAAMTDTSGSDNSDTQTRDPTAVMGRRIAAWLIDIVIYGVIVSVANMIGIIGAVLHFETTDFATSAAAEDYCDDLMEEGTSCVVSGTTVDVVEFGGIVPILGLVVVGAVLAGLLPGLTGWSLGKLAVGLRIVNKDTFNHAGIGANMLRWLCWIVDSFPFIPLVGLVTGLVNKGHRRVGDMAAKTLVIHKDDAGRPVRIAGVNQVHVSEPAAPGDQLPPVLLGTGPSDDDTPSSLAPPEIATEEPVPPAAEEPAGPAAEEPDKPSAEEPLPDDASEAGGGHDTDADQEAEPMPGVGAPHWDEARDAYIQWDPDLEEWMEWSVPRNRWIPISRESDTGP